MVSVGVFTATGRKGGTITLPNELFGREVSPKLLAQAARVYEWRAHPGRGKTKTRGEVALTTAKWYRQKGTGRARHGAKSAPIFVGGGIAHGPRGIRRNLTLSKKLARAALASALSGRFRAKGIYVVDVKDGGNIAKTKVVAALLGKLGTQGKRTLILYGGEQGLARAARNISGIKILPANMINAYSILSFPNLVITKAGLELLTKTFGTKQ